MNTIEQEVTNLVAFLSQKIGHVVTIDHLVIVSVCGTDDCWMVAWQEDTDGVPLDCQRDFVCLEGAAKFFVEKRRYLCIGSDYQDLENDDAS